MATVSAHDQDVKAILLVTDTASLNDSVPVILMLHQNVIHRASVFLLRIMETWPVVYHGNSAREDSSIQPDSLSFCACESQRS